MFLAAFTSEVGAMGDPLTREQLAAQIESVRRAVAENDWPWTAEGSVIVGRALLEIVRVRDEEITELLTMLADLLEGYEDACWQGSGNEPLSSPTWHNFLSTYEDADELIPRARVLLARGDTERTP